MFNNMFSNQSYIRKGKFLEKILLKRLSDEDLNLFHRILLDMYLDILRICKQNDIKVILGGGSALGAVRHHGFIPWDEDIDLMIDANDVEKFIEKFTEEYSDKYHIVSPFIRDKYPYMLLQIINKNTSITQVFDVSKIRPSGVTIDINLIVSVPDNYCLKLIHGFISDSMFFLINSKALYLTVSRRSFSFFSQNFVLFAFMLFRLVLGASLFFISYKRLCNLFYKWSVLFNNKTRNVTIATGRKHYFGETLSRDVFFPPKQVEFENVEAYIPAHSDDYLNNLFGSNYMDIPPKDKREPHAYVDYNLNTNGDNT